MKRSGIIHPELAQAVAALGHGDTLVIADAGLPVPGRVQRIDLAFTAGKPAFLDVLDAVLEEMHVEGAILARELVERGPRDFYRSIERRLVSLPGVGDADLHYLSHAAFKEECALARVVVRTGEFTPYANVILRSGVVF